MSRVPSRLGIIQSRIAAAVKVRLAPGRIEKEVDMMATEFLHGHVKQILGVAFGFDKRWGREYELHKGFETGAIATRLAELVSSPEVDAFLQEAIAGFRKHVKPKELREWQREYQRYFREAYWHRAQQLIELDANKYGHQRAEEDFDKLLRQTFEREADIPKGHPLSGDAEDDDA